jgi:hypothetical protein
LESCGTPITAKSNSRITGTISRIRSPAFIIEDKR